MMASEFQAKMKCNQKANEILREYPEMVSEKSKRSQQIGGFVFQIDGRHGHNTVAAEALVGNGFQSNAKIAGPMAYQTSTTITQLTSQSVVPCPSQILLESQYFRGVVF